MTCCRGMPGVPAREAAPNDALTPMHAFCRLPSPFLLQAAPFGHHAARQAHPPRVSQAPPPEKRRPMRRLASNTVLTGFMATWHTARQVQNTRVLVLKWRGAGVTLVASEVRVSRACKRAPASLHAHSARRQPRMPAR